ncbi:MAG: alpha/beta fold hydrolase [Phycisphaerales bacterium]|nr:alpha/beta fold hydrolase [Phycisphaerales bacterium]
MTTERRNEPWQRLYPFERRFFKRKGLQMHYIDEGAGAPIVMVHGNPTWSFYYRELIKAFRDSHRCIAMDHIGCGLSDKPGLDQYDYQLKSRINDVEALLDHLGIEEGVTLVVHDWGGMIGMGVALRRPERIARIVVLNTGAFLLPEGKPFMWQLVIARQDNPLTRFLVRGCNLFCWGAAIGGSVYGLDRDVRDGLLAPYRTVRDRLAVHEFVKDIPLAGGDRSYETVKSIDDGLSALNDKPMLICWGKQDFVFDDDFLAEWRRRFPKADVHVFEDAGHYVMEDARDRIVGLVRGFVTTSG